MEKSSLEKLSLEKSSLEKLPLGSAAAPRLADHPVLQRYKVALDALEAHADALSEDAILQALTARDAVQAALDKAPADPTIRAEIYRLDQRLRQQSGAIARHLDLVTWRDSLNPPASAWWWNFPKPPDPRDCLDWLWDALTVTTMAASFSLVMDISSKFLTGGTDLLGSFIIVGQSVLTLLTGKTALTQAGQEATERSLERLGVPSHYHHEAKLGLSTGLLLLLLGLHANLPRIASLYAAWGNENQSQGEMTRAEDNLRRSLALDPDNPQTHYDLGTVYESGQNPEKAIAQYRLALQGGLSQASIPLSRLYILDGQYDMAASVLMQGEQTASAGLTPEGSGALPNPDFTYSYHNNLGWIALKQGRFDEAAANLQTAIQIAPQRASAHCLLAQVWNAQGRPAVAEWQACANTADRTIPEENAWYAQAQSALQQQGF
ncbi:tetratricopeptide repeat protein [Leptolyngbya sp. O-77]|uniref:tetratricopeptide repeat protein n=1 Tax=Leptolyngbya sp. O-77 TaxID=1080068 RepID=UPI00074D36D1|nr:tetratricopeptide repeat protein [Leptolyngbya sp. O-77]BAU40399.1 tetratricopeptide repeat protein [Leptolyngbya sp. O-77]